MRLAHPLKILMFGWEFPPFNSGGLGVACQGLVKGLASQGVEITFVLPKENTCQSPFCRFVFADVRYMKGVKIKKIDAMLSPYVDSKTYCESYGELVKRKGKTIYSPDLVSEVLRYAKAARRIAKEEAFDAIHCHDWLSFPAGLAAKEISGSPLIFHVHATEFDRVGKDSMNRDIYLIEKEGFAKADMIIAVSDYTRRVIMDHYGVNPEKIRVVPNAIDNNEYRQRFDTRQFRRDGKKIVLFVGRLTFQKGPDYFLRAARRVLDFNPDVFFVFSGSGDMERWLIEESARMGIADKVFFAGFLRGADLSRVYQMADLYVMSSVSDPFGLTSLESLANGTPILVSRTTGASEMLAHCLKVDFWDVDEMTNKILAVVNYPELRDTLQANGSCEVRKFSWDESARKCLGVYREVLTA